MVAFLGWGIWILLFDLAFVGILEQSSAITEILTKCSLAIVWSVLFVISGPMAFKVYQKELSIVMLTISIIGHIFYLFELGFSDMTVLEAAVGALASLAAYLRS